MDEAAPQAAEETGSGSIDGMLATLDLLWEDLYLIGWDPERGWWATPRDRIGLLMTADSPDELSQMMTEESGTGR